jgi:adenylate cyclase
MVRAVKEKTILPFQSLIEEYALRQGVSQPVVQQRQLALFFLDIRDFTPFIGSRPAFEAMHLLQQLFAIFRQAIEANQGRIIETAGDGLYAVFGLEDSLAEATTWAFRAGQTILAEVEQANETYFGPCFNHHFQVGIGLHVGQVIVGQLGLGVNNNPTVMGYPVNVASRLQTATKRLNNSFVVSAEAFQLLNNPPMAPCEWIALKGINGRQKVHLVGRRYEATISPYASCLLAS